MGHGELGLTILLSTGRQPHSDPDGVTEPSAPQSGAAAIRGEHQQGDHPTVPITVAHPDPFITGLPGTSAWTVLNTNERAEEYGWLSRAGKGALVTVNGHSGVKTTPCYTVVLETQCFT